MCTRRAGKSRTAGVRLITRANRAGPYKGAIYFGLTRSTAKAVMWSTLQAMNREHTLGLDFHESDLIATLPNKSFIKLLGADATKDEIQKALGQAYVEAVVDEAQAFGPQLKDLCYDILLPALGDELGALTLIGTAGLVPAGFFFDVTNGLETTYPWSVHGWTYQDNPNTKVRENIERQVAMMIAHNPEVVKTAAFRRNYLKEWVIEESNQIYRFREERNRFDGRLPADIRWTYVLGVDLGFTDDTAFVLGAYSSKSPVFYIVEVESKPGMDFFDVAARIKEYQAKYRIAHVVIDGANKQGIVTMERRCGLKLEMAEKTSKQDYIELMNGELAQGYVKVYPGCPLVPEWGQLVWVRDGNKREEDERQKNHKSDACLYAWRHAFNFAYRPPGEAPPQYGTPAWFAMEERRMLAAAEKEMQRDFARQMRGY